MAPEFFLNLFGGSPRSVTRILQRTILSLSWNRLPVLLRHIHLAAPITAGCGRSVVGCLDEVLLHDSGSGIIIVVCPNFCVASSIPVASWALTTTQLATMMEPIHLSSTPYIRGSFRVTCPCLLMKRVAAVGAVGRANVSACLVGVDGKHWAMRTQRDGRHVDAICPDGGHLDIRPHSRKLRYEISSDLFYESAGLLSHLLSQMPSYYVWQRVETSRWRMTLK